MKNSHKLLLAFALLAIIAATLWGWKRDRPTSANPPRRGDIPLLRDYTAVPEQAETVTPQEAKTPAASGAAPRKFVEMTARESREILRQITTIDPDELFQLFLDAGRIDQDPQKQSALQGKLANAIKAQTPTAEFTTKMKRFVMDESNSKLERGLLTSAFADAHTKEGTEFVFWALANQTDPDLKQGVISNISGLGGSQPYLPAMIEPLWRESKDVELLNAVAMAMAREGAPSSIELLLPALAAPKGEDDVRRRAALWGLKKVYRKEAVPALKSALENSPPGSPMSEIALDIMSRLGDESASRAVVGWLQNADSSAAAQVSAWIGRGAHTAAAEAALNPSVNFRSEKNREAIRTALAAQRAAITEEFRPGQK